MSSAAAAAALALPQAAGAVRILAGADGTTIVGALTEMPPPGARLIEAMDAGRAAELLSQAAPVTVARIVRNVAPATKGRRCCAACLRNCAAKSTGSGSGCPPPAACRSGGRADRADRGDSGSAGR